MRPPIASTLQKEPAFVVKAHFGEVYCKENLGNAISLKNVCKTLFRHLKELPTSNSRPT
jgi:hypothetical protein